MHNILDHLEEHQHKNWFVEEIHVLLKNTYDDQCVFPNSGQRLKVYEDHGENCGQSGQVDL